jgi:hypothetical protein
MSKPKKLCGVWNISKLCSEKLVVVYISKDLEGSPKESDRLVRE